MQVIPEGWTVVARAQGLLEAEIVAGRLRSCGLETYLDYEVFGALASLSVDGLGEVRVAVPEDQEALALELLKEA